jgi:uncharacterized protein (UPF0332 family)
VNPFSETILASAKVLVREKSSDFAAGRAYYGMFYVAEALLNEKGTTLSQAQRD